MQKRLLVRQFLGKNSLDDGLSHRTAANERDLCLLEHGFSFCGLLLAPGAPHQVFSLALIFGPLDLAARKRRENII